METDPAMICTDVHDGHRRRECDARPFGSRGFSLIELMIVVAIISILAGIAYPNYQEYITKATRNAAKGIMLDLAQAEERYLTNNGLFLAVPTPGALGTCQELPWPNYSGSACASRKYDIGVAVDNSTLTYTITATPSNGFADSACETLTLQSSGQKTSSAGTACW